MSKKLLLRLISSAMLITAAIFVVCAISCPTLGRTIYIGPFAFGYKQWRVCYALYLIVMLGLFIAAFFADGKKR